MRLTETPGQVVSWALSRQSTLSEPTGWPACPRGCSSRGECSHIGVCSCRRGWGGDDCSEPRCPERCSGHGHCIASDLSAACVCDEGFFGDDCTERAVPPLPPAAAPSPAPLWASALPALAASSSLVLHLNVSERAFWLPSGRSQPLGSTLPLGAWPSAWPCGRVAGCRAWRLGLTVIRRRRRL